jgi:site-specific DNA recombinase
MQEASDPKRVTRCAIYTRLSAEQDPKVEFTSCEAQAERVRAFVTSQTGFMIFKAYSDAGHSGGTLERPGLQAMLSDIGQGHVDMVLTAKIDRLTRSHKDFYQLMEFFEKRKVGYISVGERFDTSTATGRLVLNIMLTFAQFEREQTSERIKVKTLQRAQKGMYIGGVPPFGYKVENGKLVLDPPRDEAVRVIFNAYAETQSVREAHRRVRRMGVISSKGRPIAEPTVWHVLTKEVYTGQVIYQGKAYPGQHPAIITRELFDYVQELRKKGFKDAARVPALPFAGLIRCEECDSVMTSTFTDKKNKDGLRRYHYYRCSKLTHLGKDKCSTRQINAERFHDILYRNLLRISMDTTYLENLCVAQKNRIQNPAGGGLEPDPIDGALSPENLEKMLKEFLNACARRTGMERILAIRRQLAGISYSKKTISVHFFFARPPDGSCLSKSSPSAAALRAAPPFCPPARKIEKPNSCSPLGSSVQFETSEMVLGTGLEPVTPSMSRRYSNQLS